jgi:hypothetical protein
MRSVVVSPDWMILSAARSCASKNRPRRPSQASVEVAETTGISPSRVPKRVSTPQIAASTSASTPVEARYPPARTDRADPGPARGDILLRSDEGEVVLRRAAELRLVAVAFHDAGQEALTLETTGERSIGDPHGARAGPERPAHWVAVGTPEGAVSRVTATQASGAGHRRAARHWVCGFGTRGAPGHRFDGARPHIGGETWASGHGPACRSAPGRTCGSRRSGAASAPSSIPRCRCPARSTSAYRPSAPAAAPTWTSRAGSTAATRALR